MKKTPKIPAFMSEAEERAYREREDSTADLDWRRAERVRLPDLQPSTVAISLRLPVSLLQEIKIAAHKPVADQDVARGEDGVGRGSAAYRLAYFGWDLLFWLSMARI